MEQNQNITTLSHNPNISNDKLNSGSIYELSSTNNVSSNIDRLLSMEDLPTRMAKGFADSAVGIVQNLVEVGADIHDTVVPTGYESLLNPLANKIGQVKDNIGYVSGIDYKGMQEGLQKEGLSGFWDKFKIEDLPELVATSLPYTVSAYNPASFGAVSAALAKDMAKNTAINEGRNPNDTTLTDTLTAMPAALAVTALDSLLPNTMSANIIKTITGRTITTGVERATNKGISNLVKNVAESVVTEGATESMQELIQFAQEHKGTGVFEPEALAQYGVAGLLGGMSGGATDIALKPIHTYQNIKASFTGESTPPIQQSLDSSRLSGITSTEGFSNKPEAEKQEWIDTNFGKITLADGLGRLDIVNGNGSISTMDFNLNPTPDENGNIVYATYTDPTGAKIDISKQGEMINHVYDILQAKIESFDSIDNLTDYVNSIGISSSPLLQSKLLEEVANVNKAKLEAIQSSEELGSAKDTVSNDNTSNAIKSIHSTTIKESNSFNEEQLWKSIGRMVFNPETMNYIDLPSRKKTPVLAEVTAYEQKIRLYKYLQRFLNVNEERTAKILDFIKKQYNMQGTIKNGILSFADIKEAISEPVVEQTQSSPSITIPQANAKTTTTGSDMAKITRQDLKNNPNKVYIFGDNLEQKGYGGQAKEMRGEPNAYGIPTKKKPSMSENSFFNDNEFEANKKAIDEAISKIPTDKEIVIPKAGIGTGLASLETKAPRTFKYLQDKLAELQNKQETVKSTKQENIPVEEESKESAVADTVETQGFSRELNDKLVKVLTKLYPEIKLEYTENEIKYVDNNGNIMNQTSVNNIVKYTLKSIDILSNIGQQLPVVRLNSKEKPNAEMSISNLLSKKGVPKDQIEYMFEYMKQNDIKEISSSILAEKLLFGLMQNVEIRNTNSEAYKSVSVDGGTNYKEIEIVTPNIKVLHQGHASFSTDKGIGWYRVDNAVEGGTAEQLPDFFVSKEGTIWERSVNGGWMLTYTYPDSFSVVRDDLTDFDAKAVYPEKLNTVGGKETKTLRVLEIQSDMFQKMKGTNLSNLSSNEQVLDRALHQLLNTDNKWIKFFVKSIIQNAQQNGYESIRFPSGETAATIEGHEKSREVIDSINNAILSPDIYLHRNPKNTQAYNYGFITRNIQVFGHDKQEFIDNLKAEKEKFKLENLEKNFPIEGFYQNRIQNTLIKEYGKDKIKTVTDEYGNSWFELKLDKNRDSSMIMLQQQNGQIKGQADLEAKTVLINSLLQSQDTLPHEYAHHYISWFRDAPMVKEAIRKWGSEEALVQAIGEQVVKQKGEVYRWWKQFTAWLQEKFDNLSNATKEELRNALTDAFLTRQDLSNIGTDVINDTVESFTSNTNEKLKERQKTRLERASKIADRIGVDIQTQTNNLISAIKALQTSLASMIPSSEQLDKYATNAKYYVGSFANQDFIKVFGLNDKSTFYTTGYLGALNSIYNNQPMRISMEDEDTNTYYTIMSLDNIDMINDFGGVMFDEIISSLARTLTKEFGLKPTNRLDDNAYSKIDDNAYKASMFVLKSLIAQGIIEELSVEDIDGNLHRFYKLADSNSYSNVSAYTKELATRDIRTPFNSLNTPDRERANVDKTQLRSNGVKISTTIRTAMSKLQQQSYNLNQEMLNDVLLNKELMEDEEFVNNISKYTNPNDVHINFRDDIKARNDAYRRTLDRLIDYGKETLTDTFWYKYQNNTNARFQPYATVANPVTDKLFARWMVDNANEDSKYTVVKGSNKKTTYYWKNAIVLAMSEAKILDIKADKVDGKTNLEAFDSLADNSTIQKAISFMDSGKKNKAIKLMSKGGFHSIRAFLDYYKYSKLNDNGFMKTSMPTEVDGITNGLAMQLLQIGNGTIADTAKYLNMVGIFLHGEDIKSIYEYRNKGLDDLYTSVANSVASSLKQSVASDFFTEIKAMGRDVAKSPVMVWLYNAGDIGIQLKVGYSILESFMNTVNNKTINSRLIENLKDYYSNEYYSNELYSNKLTDIKPNDFNRIVDKIVNNKEKLTNKEMSIMQSAFGNTVGALIISSMDEQFEAMSNVKALFSLVSHYINRTFHQRFKAEGKKSFDNQILLKDASDSGVSTYTMDKELNSDKKYGIYYIGENNRVSSMSASPVEKVIQTPFNAKGKPRGEKRGYVVNTHNNDSIAMAESIISTIDKQQYFGFPVFDAYVGAAGNIDTFVDSYNNNLYNINKSYSVLESLKSALIKAGNSLNSVSYDILMKQLNTAINSNEQLKAAMYSDTGIDKSLMQQMSGVQPYSQYIESNKELGSSNEKNMGEFVETKLLQKDTSDFAKLYTDIEENDAVQISDEFNNYLKQIVNNVTKFLGDYQDITKVHMYKGNKNVGKYYKEELTLSLSDTYTFGMSGREVYAHELMHKLTKDAYDNDVKARNEMNDTFRQFREYVAKNNVNINADTLSYILSRNDANEFIAFVATNEEVMNATKNIILRPNSNLTLFEKVQLFVKTFINNMMRLVRAGNHPELAIHNNLYDRATSIAYELMTVNKKMKSVTKENSFGALFRVTQKINKPIAANIARTINAIKSSSLGNALSNSFNNYGIAYKIANNKYVRILSNEIMERPEAEENQLKLSGYANMVQANYMQVSNAIASKTNELVSNADTITRANLKETIIDLDLSSTMINSAEAANYLINDKARITEIKRIENYLLSLATTDKQKNTVRYMINQARGLGYYLATYDAYLNNAQLLNADNITNFNLIKHSSNVERLNVDMKSLTADIDRLASLCGISYTHKDVRTNAGNYMLGNLENMDKIMEYVLAEVNTSKQQLFNLKGEKHLFIKGYSSTIVDRNYTYTVVPESQLGMYQKHYWKIVSDIVETDRVFGNKQNKMFLMKRVDVDAGYESGILSIQSPTSKGTVLDSIGISSKNSDFKLNVDSYIDRLYSKDDMSTGQMIPLFSPNTKDGISIANYRYSMSKDNKKNYLAMKSDISNVLAETKSMTDRKIHENELNETIVKTLIDDFINHKDAAEFVEVGADTEYKDQWNMLPRHTRQYIVSQLGTNSIYVRKQMLNEYFGYKNLDLSTLLHLKKEYYPLQLLEKIWRDSVKIVRNSIVLKTLSTIFNNEMSNIRTLMTEMPIDKAFKYVAEGWQATDSYRNDHKRLLQIEQMIASRKPYDKNEYNRLKKSIAMNPVKDLFDAGKFEAVVDDMNLERHEVNNIVERYADRAVNKLPSKLRSIVNTIYLTEDTTIFKSLAKFVLYSDFTARYALYKNAIEKGLSKEEALSDGDKYFIRYSVLQDKHLKYVGDLGLFMFSKYLLRIQKGIYRMLKKNPTAVLQQKLAEHMIGKSSDILDSGLWNINLGRFNTFGSSLTELGDPHLLTELHIL